MTKEIHLKLPRVLTVALDCKDLLTDNMKSLEQSQKNTSVTDTTSVLVINYIAQPYRQQAQNSRPSGISYLNNDPPKVGII